MQLEGNELVGRLHWGIVWVLLPALALWLAPAAGRAELSTAWRRTSGSAVLLIVAVLALRAALHGLAHWALPRFAWWLAPPVALVGLLLSLRSVGRALGWLALLSVSLMGWVALLLNALQIPVDAIHDGLFLLALPLAAAGLWKHLSTPRAQPVQAAEDAARDAAINERLNSAEAQESADKYTRE